MNKFFFIAFLAACILPSLAKADAPEVALSVGYAHLYTHQGQDFFRSKDGAYVDGDFAWKLPTKIPALVGFGVSGSGYFDDADSGLSYYNGYRWREDNLYSDVGTFQIEPRIGLTLWSPFVKGLFLKPRFGAGLQVNSYAVDSVQQDLSSYSYIHTRHHTGAAFEIHPNLQAGIALGHIAFGAEASYIPAWGDFGELGSLTQELRIGGFFTWRY